MIRQLDEDISTKDQQYGLLVAKGQGCLEGRIKNSDDIEEGANASTTSGVLVKILDTPSIKGESVIISLIIESRM